MKLVFFVHSLISCWNHSSAHFLRGVVSELLARGHAVDVYEPRSGWSLANLRSQEGEAPLRAFRRVFPELRPRFYDPARLDLDAALDGADVVIVHERNPPAWIARIGSRRRTGRFRLLYHDTHHGAVSAPEILEKLDLSSYDGVLAFGDSLRRIYRERGLAQRVWTWHEAADVRRFHPRPQSPRPDDLVWIGSWDDDERCRELGEFLLAPARALALRGNVYGAGYPAHARAALRASGLRYAGWLPNHEVPEVFARHRVTVHVPRRFYRTHLPGIPTIRVFEALACGIPLVSAPWPDGEALLRPGRDFLEAKDGEAMTRHLRDLLHDADAARDLAEQGQRTVLARHTCSHRVDELLDILAQLDEPRAPGAPQPRRLPRLPAPRSDRHPPRPGVTGTRAEHARVGGGGLQSAGIRDVWDGIKRFLAPRLVSGRRTGWTS